MNAVYPARRMHAIRPSIVPVVKPLDEDFEPTNWQNKPTSYQVVARFKFDRLGQADTKRFIFNQVARKEGSAGHRWCITG